MNVNLVYDIYLIMLFCSSIITLSIAVYLWRVFWLKKKIIPARSLSVMIFAVTFWAVGCALALKSGTIEGTYFWERIKYLGLLTVPSAWYIFSMRWTGHYTSKMNRRSVIFLYIVPVLLSVMVLTDPLHHLVWTEFEPVLLGSYIFDRVVHGQGWWLLWTYSTILIVAGLANLITAIISLSRIYANQARLLLLGVLLPWITNTAFALNLTPLLIDITPAVFILSCLIYIQGIKRFNMIDMVPAARERIFDQMNDPVFVLDTQDRIIDMNQAAADMTSGIDGAVLGMQIQSALFRNLEIEHKIPRIEKQQKEIRIGSGADVRYFEVRIDPLNRNGEIISGHIVTLHDITAWKKIEHKIRASVKEKDILLKEIHHRVKNNMQIVVSLLRLQAAQIPDERLKTLFSSSENRIRTMALIHERLYKTENCAEIDFGEFIRFLAVHLQRLHTNEERTIVMDMQLDPVRIGLTKAVPCGLMVQEILSNCFLHAFPGDKSGKIRLSLRPDHDDRVELIISDDGVGISETFDIEQSESLGLQLVSDFVRQIEGTLNIDREKGTTFHITFTQDKYQPAF